MGTTTANELFWDKLPPDARERMAELAFSIDPRIKHWAVTFNVQTLFDKVRLIT